jgi:lipopolysaccharide biosynthesis regulator YciM
MNCPKHKESVMIKTVLQKELKQNYIKYVCFECGFILKQWEKK